MNKFHVGEEVIIFCPIYPEIHNITTTVLDIISQEECYKLYPFVEIQSLYCYNVGTTIDLVNDFGQRSGIFCNHVGEGILRKKHKPSTESYSDLLKSIKEGVINA